MLQSRLLLCSLLLSGVCAGAQVRSSHSESTLGIYGGFSYVSNDGSFSARDAGANLGGKIGADFHAFPWLALAAEFMTGTGRVTNVSATTYTVLVGPRVFVPIPGVSSIRPYADALFGGTHVGIAKSADSLNSRSSGTAAFDVGTDYRFSRHIAWRGQFGYLYSGDITHINDEIQNVPNPPHWHLQVFTGPSIRF